MPKSQLRLESRDKRTTRHKYRSSWGRPIVSYLSWKKAVIYPSKKMRTRLCLNSIWLPKSTVQNVEAIIGSKTVQSLHNSGISRHTYRRTKMWSICSLSKHSRSCWKVSRNERWNISEARLNSNTEIDKLLWSITSPYSIHHQKILTKK